MSTTLSTANHDTTGSRNGIAWLAYFFLGVCFGITLTQSEVLSWFRIQEMFRFQSPRMYEIIASAMALAGACPGPMFALVGNGVSVMIGAIGSALAGTWLYGLLRPRLPH